MEDVDKLIDELTTPMPTFGAAVREKARTNVAIPATSSSTKRNSSNFSDNGTLRDKLNSAPTAPFASPIVRYLEIFAEIPWKYFYREKKEVAEIEIKSNKTSPQYLEAHEKLKAIPTWVSFFTFEH